MQKRWLALRDRAGQADIFGLPRSCSVIMLELGNARGKPAVASIGNGWLPSNPNEEHGVGAGIWW